jgi:hypothetical protein
MRFFSDRIASLGCTVFDRIRSEISRLVAMSSRLEEVAFSICSSRGETEVNQPAIFIHGLALIEVRKSPRGGGRYFRQLDSGFGRVDNGGRCLLIRCSVKRGQIELRCFGPSFDAALRWCTFWSLRQTSGEFLVVC